MSGTKAYCADGIAMGPTAIALIYPPGGRRSGTHFNPSMTLTFVRQGKMKRIDAGLYSLYLHRLIALKGTRQFHGRGS